MVRDLLSPVAARDASRAVQVVPMLLPKVRGNILSSEITPIPTRGVNAEVNTLLLCTSIVIPIPTTMNRYLKFSYIMFVGD